MRHLSLAITLLLVVGVALPAGAEVTRSDLDAARAEINAISADLEDQTAELDEVIDQQFIYEQQITRIRQDIASRDREIALAALKARDQARSMYVSAGGDFQAAVSPEAITRLGTKTAYLEAVIDLDLDVANQLELLQGDRANLQRQIEKLVAEQEDLAADMEALAAAIFDQLAAADDRYQTLNDQWQKEEAERRRRAEEERRRRAAAAAASTAAASASAASTAAASASTGNASSAYVDPSGRTCPVAGANTFSDTWGAPRSGGTRRHTGIDMVAATGTPLVAMENGYIWSPNWHWAGGIGLYVRGDSGDIYYYAHLSRYADGLFDGQRVGVGQVVGYVGQTGNATLPILHLGYQPGGGPLTNAYQLLVKLCR